MSAQVSALAFTWLISGAWDLIWAPVMRIKRIASSAAPVDSSRGWDMCACTVRCRPEETMFSNNLQNTGNPVCD